MTALPTIVRDARADDAQAIRRIAIASWPVTYRGLLPDTFIEVVLEKTYDLTVLADAIERCTKSSTAHFLVASRAQSGQVVGFLEFGEGVDGPELFRMYVDETARSRGVGQMLVNALHQRLGAGTSYVALVHRQNHRALGFYERYGASVIGRVDGQRLFLSRYQQPAANEPTGADDLRIRIVVPHRGATGGGA